MWLRNKQKIKNNYLFTNISFIPPYIFNVWYIILFYKRIITHGVRLSVLWSECEMMATKNQHTI